MSVDINWETLTGGPNGEVLAETIRDFIHERFQQVHFPKLIRSVKVHAFDFGTVKPEIVLKDIGDPLQDFYEDEDEDEGAEDGDLTGAGNDEHQTASPPAPLRPTEHHTRSRENVSRSYQPDLPGRTREPTLARGGPPGMFGATSNLGYFHLPLSAGLSGTSTPFAAVAGAHWHNGLSAIDESTSRHSEQSHHRHADSFDSTGSPPELTPLSSRPVSRDNSYFERQGTSGAAIDSSTSQGPSQTGTDRPDRNPEDMQVVFHLTYSGNVRLSMTAEVFLDYPMPAFVGIPLKLNITGIKFNGVGILAYIKRRAHLCFLSPGDAEALIGSETVTPASPGEGAPEPVLGEEQLRVGGLLEEIKIESEMGESTDGKQVLKNVGKIEKFILEQVQRILEDEFVYPSFWTFLV